MKKILFVISIIALLIVAGCGEKTVVTDDGTTVTTTQSGKEVKQTITTDEGTIKSEGTIGKEGWCAEGTDWKWSSDTAQGMGSGTMKVDKIITSGKYEGLCHVVYTWEAEGQSGQWDYYFSEDGESGYYVMDLNGQKIEQEWHG